ncbi:MAG TPA: phenylalanine--tRNA ligase beta subunit-related protein [Candidatus Peribacterales bacterium]|nr:phenylalanine--tRNA ligase beta subunit-related protein [Candidatus Peribacterales bacterium]
MQCIIDPQILEKNSGLMVGVLVVKGVDNVGAHSDIVSLLRQAETNVSASLTIETFKDHPKLKVLQEVHQAFGSNPNKFPPSVQALVKRVLKGGQLPTINPLVDLYNVISLKYLLCAGGEDTDQCIGDIHLTYATGNEEFIGLGETENDPPDAGEVIYCDDKGVICRKFNWREGDRTKLTEKTRNCVLVIEARSPILRSELEEALNELKAFVEKYCGGSVRTEILDQNHQSCDL